MTNRVFLDSNVWVYFFSDDKNYKAGVVQKFLDDNAIKYVFITSCQIVNEVCNVLKRHGLTEKKIRFVIDEITSICLIQDLSKEISLLASKLREKYSFSFWDSIIVATAKIADCILLVSEDMQDGLVIDQLRIKNIF